MSHGHGHEGDRGLVGHSAIARALGLEGRDINSLSINVFNHTPTLVSVNFNLAPAEESALAEAVRDYYLVERNRPAPESAAETFDRLRKKRGPIEP